MPRSKDGKCAPWSSEPDRFVGHPITPDLLERWTSGASDGVLEAVSPDGVHVLTAFSRLPEPYGWGVAVAVPKATLTRSALISALTLLAIEAAVLTLGLLLAREIARGVLRPITDLLKLAASLDNLAPRARALGLPEADQLAQALLAETRQRRAATASLVDSERRLRLVVAELNHRAKNALATVQSLAMQTARGSAAGDPARRLSIIPQVGVQRLTRRSTAIAPNSSPNYEKQRRH
ncbi:sensor histidine kinase [Roseomonas nepalensis]|uniref:histidine kinase n=1 Tax=Muricoccus nepalensis TaxID=1854500 RepID=A0A502FXF1_9PROT|nr:HWE histidine kinase domain-containing protein [Roseomonas nepalensis]TPG53623.1 sensor histidine kinase [Roseomonas nepalensis]